MRRSGRLATSREQLERARPRSLGLETVHAKLAADPGEAERPTRQTASGLRYVDLQLGQGELAEPGRRVVIHYVGTLVDDSVFDSSRERGTPFEFGLGKNQVIRGFEEGVTGMRVGGKRRLDDPARPRLRRARIATQNPTKLGADFRGGAARREGVSARD